MNNLIIDNQDYFISNFNIPISNDIFILEFSFHPIYFPSITSYYIMNKSQLDHFEYQYFSLKHKSLNDFLYNEKLSIDNSNYFIYNYINSQSNNFITIFNFIKYTSSNGASCDLISHFYNLLNNDKLNDNLDKINIKNDNIIDNDSDELYKNTEDISNILDIVVKLKDKCILNCYDNDNINEYCENCKNSINIINDIYKNNNNIINDDDIKELITKFIQK